LILWIIPIFVALKIYEIRYESILFLEFTAVYYLVLCITPYNSAHSLYGIYLSSGDTPRNQSEDWNLLNAT